MVRITVASVLAVLSVFALVGCSMLEPADCRKAELVTYADEMEDQITAFRQQSDLVAASPRMGIAAPLQRLLDIQTETRDVATPGCASDHHDRTMRVMQLYQTAYQGFASQQMDDTVAAMLLAEAKKQLDTQELDLVQIRAGTIPPTPLPEPSPEPVNPPEPGVVQKSTLLLSSPGTAATGSFEVCPDDRFRVFGRQTVDDVEWVQIRVMVVGENCASILPHVTEGLEGWLRDSDVFAP